MCNCGKNAGRNVPIGDGRGRRAAAPNSVADAALLARTKVATPQPKPAPSQPIMEGATQSFALIRDGRRIGFGSQLERDADRARHGGVAV